MGVMERRRALMGMQTELPGIYRAVEYVRSNGVSYILTDVYPSNDLGFDCVFWTDNPMEYASYGCVFGGRRSSGTDDFQLTTFTQRTSNNGTFRFGAGANNGGEYNAGITRAEIQHASLRELVYKAPTGVETQVNEYNWSTPYPITLFLLNQGSSNFYQGGTGCRIYKMEFYHGRKLFRKYIPCVRKQDNKVGMYEVFTKTFLTTPQSTLYEPE